MRTKQEGQSLIDVIFAVGVLIVTLTGILFLVNNVVGSKTKTFDRKKATELGQLVMENLVYESQNNPANFWALRVTPAVTPFVGYSYRMGMGNSGAGIGASVTVIWVRDSNYSVTFNRYFSRTR